MRRALSALALGLGGLSLAAAADEAKLKSYGRHLAQECTGCHRIDGVDNGIPSIVGWDAERFMTTMRFYQAGAAHQPRHGVGRKVARRGPAARAGRLLRLAAEAAPKAKK